MRRGPTIRSAGRHERVGSARRRTRVLRLSPEQVAYLKVVKTVLSKPEWVQRPTWRESLVATREALRQWEALQDRLALHKAGVVLGPWYVLGPVPPNGKVARQIQAANRIDVTAHYDDEHGKQFAWQKCENLADAQVNELAGYDKEGCDLPLPQLVVYGAIPPREIYLDMAADGAAAWWLPEHQGPGMESSLPILRGGSNMMREETERQFVDAIAPPMPTAGGGLFHAEAESRPPRRRLDQRAMGRRHHFCERMPAKYPDPADSIAKSSGKWQAEIWIDEHNGLTDWAPGGLDNYLKLKYRAGIQRRLAQFDALLAEKTAVQALALQPLHQRLADWADTLRTSLTPSLAADALRSKYCQLARSRKRACWPAASARCGWPSRTSARRSASGIPRRTPILPRSPRWRRTRRRWLPRPWPRRELRRPA